MTPDQEKNNKKTAPKKFNWSKAQRVATEVTVMAASAFLGGLAMAAGQQVVNHYVDTKGSSDKNVFTIVKDRSAV